MKNVLTGYISLFLLLTASAWAQPGEKQERTKLTMDLPHLEEKADEVVSVNLEGKSLDLGQKVLALRKEISSHVKDFVRGLKGVYLRRFWFSRKKAYSREDTEPIRKQLQDAGYQPMIDVQDRQKPEAYSIYSLLEDEEIAGVALVSEEPQEFTVINILGPVDLQALSELGGQMGIPVMNLATRELPKKKAVAQPEAVPPEQ